jgi:signal transduction histidine kinase/ActR/RegA family two-component response regulator
MTLAHATSEGRQRILVHAPRGRDAEVVCRVLETRFARPWVCDSLATLVQAIEAGADLAFVTEETLCGPGLEALGGWIEAQPPWSDFPFVVLTARRAGQRPSDARVILQRLGNVVLLERPLNAETLISAAQAALRARARQYESRRHLKAEQESHDAERLANAEAMRAKQALEVAVDAGELGTFHCPFPLGEMQCSARSREHLFFRREGPLGFDDLYGRVHAGDRGRVRAAIAAAADGGDVCDIEFRALSSAQEERWIRLKGRVYRDLFGQPLRLDGVTLDITRQKQLESEREALLLAERQARLEAERAGRMKDEFLATLSHELRTPLSAILGWTHLLQHAGASAIDRAKAVATIERNARAQAKLIEALLDVSRIASGNFELEIRKVALGTVFEAAVQALQPMADAKGVRLERTDLGADIELQADPGRLQQIVWNLLSNAIKFTGRGGRVTLHAEVVAREAWLSVTDTGTGITADFLPHVFERFRQAESSEARSFGGLGLGLAIVRQLVELHGGSVEARSEGADRGATFVVRLPLDAAGPRPTAAEPAAAAKEAAAPAPGELDGLRVLIVDDEADGRDMLAQLLAMRGAHVAAVGSAEEALESLDGALPDILVSDIGMPRVDGYELMRRIRRRDRSGARDLPAIALTAFARLGDADKARAAGYDAHLAKPVEPAELFVAIRKLVAHRRPPGDRLRP